MSDGDPNPVFTARVGQTLDVVVRTIYRFEPGVVVTLRRSGDAADGPSVAGALAVEEGRNVVRATVDVPTTATQGQVYEVWASGTCADTGKSRRARGWTVSVISPADELSSGDGDFAVNHDTGGTDNLRFVDPAGVGIDGAKVIAYIAADYAAGVRKVVAQTFTGSDGRWVEDLYLDADTYRFVFVLPGVRTASKEQEIG